MQLETLEAMGSTNHILGPALPLYKFHQLSSAYES
jgi:hypothetical protein